MCWVAAIPLAVSAIGAAGQMRAGADAKETAALNAQIAGIQAQDSLSRGGVEEDRYRRQIAQIAGAQKSVVASRNVKAGTGTALDLLSDTAQIGEEDALTIRNESARESWGYRFQADESRRYGKSAYRNSQYAAGSTLLTGGAQAYGLWRQT
jgi:hypothetical protein